jgi:hypothetical protein
MITQKSASSNAEEVLSQIEKAAQREFLPIVGPIKAKSWLKRFGKLSQGMFWKLAL